MEEEDMDKLSKEELKSKYEAVNKEIAELKAQVSDLENDNWYLECDVSNLEEKYEDLLEEARIAEKYVDMKNFKQKLTQYNLDSEELLNFIDLYMKLYNN